ncbi:MAG: protein-glutamate O-methyltransferase CheR [Chitinispirillaceae bacterium]|nr:protein-glutamate O-methyltransferase CheR [Chitinispirillaceae bacterium]
MIPVTSQELQLWGTFIKSVCGNNIEDKAYLIESRLSPIAKELNCDSWQELYYKVKNDISGTLKRKIINAITTNETSFFRDNSPFEMLKYKILPDLIDKRKKTTPSGSDIPIRIWSAACSTGQELYSIAIAIRETVGNLKGYDVRLLGTDISDDVVTKASRGIYGKIEIERGLAPDMLNRYFEKKDSEWKIKDEIRALATFKHINLLESVTFPNKFDIVFCRNVAIYFLTDDRKKLYTNIGKELASDGYLIIGATESLANLCPQFQSFRYLRSVYYQLKR